MPTINQLIRVAQEEGYVKHKDPSPAGPSAAACARVYTTTPKPNSALRKVARVPATASKSPRTSPVKATTFRNTPS